MKTKLEIKIGRLRFKNPVMAASGTFGPEYKKLVDINSLGAYVAKTITLKPRTGNPPPRIAETASGMLNAIGLENPGVEEFLKKKMPELRKLRIPLVASIAGDDEDEYSELAGRLGRAAGIDAIEINLSCPNVRHGDREGLMAQDEKAVSEVIKACRKATRLTLIAKLAPNVIDIKRIAKAAEGAGADALLVANTYIGMAVDIKTRKPKLGNITGGLSGPAIKPLTLRLVWETCKKVDIPIIGSGGIMDYKDALEFILCGATAIQVGTANFVNPRAANEISEGIKKYMAANRVKDIKDLVGRLVI